MEAILTSFDDEYLNESFRSYCVLTIWLIQEESEEKGAEYFYFVILSINDSQATCLLASSIQLVIHDIILIIVRLWLIEMIKRAC